MDKNQYSQKLRDPRWQKKRLEILQRDEWSCQSCFDSSSTLVVHHRRYLPGVEPWDHPDYLLITLCESCHEIEKEERGSTESDLIEMLREKFLAPALHDLATGFLHMELQHSQEVVASAYSWALSTPEIQRELIDRFFDDLKAKAQKPAP